MTRSLDVGVPKRLLQYFVAGFVVFLVLVSLSRVVALLARSLGYSGSSSGTLLGIVLFAVLWVGLTVWWVRTARQWSGRGSFWEPIPEEQYLGRFAESGGLARHSWEKALRQLPGNDDEKR